MMAGHSFTHDLNMSAISLDIREHSEKLKVTDRFVVQFTDKDTVYLKNKFHVTDYKMHIWQSYYKPLV
jgi:hypothetical protein